MNAIKKSLLGLLLALFVCPQIAWAEEDTMVPAEFANYHTWYEFRDKNFSFEDKGSMEDPIVITTPEQLAQLAYVYNTTSNEDNLSSDWGNKLIIIDADINLNKTVDGERVQWIPIGYSLRFPAAVMGIDARDEKYESSKRHTISGMYINLTADNCEESKTFFGLFGHSIGYIGYLDMKDCEISVDFSKNDKSRHGVGLLMGECINESRETQEIYLTDEHNSKRSIKTAVESVSVQGSINYVGNRYNNDVGGMVGCANNWGFFHCASDVNIVVERANAGGLCGYLGKVKINQDTDKMGAFISDCIVQVNMTYNCTLDTEPYSLGGVCGYMDTSSDFLYNSERQTVFEATSAMGSITVKNGATHVGGIVGDMEESGLIAGCSSTVTLIGGTYVGGIVGDMGSYARTEATDNKPYVTPVMVTHSAYSGHIDGTNSELVGGICAIDGQENDISINSCLFTGTMTLGENTKGAIITASCKMPEENVGGCYYDSTLCVAPLVNTETKHSSIVALSTAQLTQGTQDAINMLFADDNQDYTYQLEQGLYPRVECSRGNTTFYSGNIMTVPFSASVAAPSSSLYRSGAWLCSLPVNITDGDVAYDLVTRVISPDRRSTWENGERTLDVRCKTTYPNLDCIRIANDTAYAVSNGEFLLTMTQHATTPQAIKSLPLPLAGTKQLGLLSTIDQVWDGSVAEKYATGMGKKEDPYIIKNGAQLALAVQSNKEGEWFTQLCDINLNNPLLAENSSTANVREWINTKSLVWKAQYDGNGHFVKGASLGKYQGLFGDVSEYGAITSLGIVDSEVRLGGGIFARNMDGTITNCIAEGRMGYSFHNSDDDYYMSYAGGICALVGPNNPDALVEDCITAVNQYGLFSDLSPFVSLSDKNKGTVRNCLCVVPTIYADACFDPSDITVSGKNYIQSCYWLKGYEQLNTGYTLSEICTALGERKLWTNHTGYFPTLRTFADTDMAKLLMIPFRTDEDYTFEAGSSNNYLLGLSRQIVFEPGNITWRDISNIHVETDSEMGIVVPVSASYNANAVIQDESAYRVRTILGTENYYAHKGKFCHIFPLRTRLENVDKGITFVDENARKACVAAFDSNNNGYISLQELKAVTTEQTLTAFQTETARQIVHFPEFRFFKAVDTLSTQLNGLSKLEDVQMPYSTTTVNSDAFYGCASLKEITISSKVSAFEQHPFYGSAISQIKVDPFNKYFVSRDGVLFDTNDVLIAYPNGRTDEEAVVTGTVSEIADGGIYRIDGLRKLYFETDDYTTVPYLNESGIVSDDDETLIDVYVSDATYGSELMQGYYDDDSWDTYVNASKLHCYYPLHIGDAKAATLFIGFPTKLPSALQSYIVTSTDVDEKTVYLKQMAQEIPDRTPIVIFADEPGLYRLTPCEGLERWKMYENKLNGVGRDGMYVYQSDSDRGSILTLGNNSEGTLGFYYYKGSFIKPYRAYLTYNFVENAKQAAFNIIFENEGIATGISTTTTVTDNQHWYTLDGRKLPMRPTQKGIYIHGGRKVVITR